MRKSFLLNLKSYSLLLIFLFTQVLFLLASSFETSIIEETLDELLGFAILFHVISIAFFILGYKVFFLKNNMKMFEYIERKTNIYDFDETVKRTLYLICIFGVVVSFVQIGQFVSLETYFSDLITFSNPGDVRENFLATKDDGGLEGIFKMWAYGPLAVLLFTASINTFLKLNYKSKISTRNLLIFSLCATVIKVMISLDGLSILAIILAFLIFSIQNNTLFKLRNIIVISLVFIFTAFISNNRLSDVGIFGFLVLYCRLGLLNVGILFDTLQTFSMGFFTVWAPIRPIIKFFSGKEIGLESLNYESSWHAAQYLLGYSYLDFGYLFFVIYIALGFIAAKFDFECSIRHSPRAVSIYFSLAYCYASFIFVPAFTGIEFWLTLAIGLYAKSGLKAK